MHYTGLGFFPEFFCGTKFPILQKFISLKFFFISPWLNYHFLSILWIYPGRKFVNPHQFCGTPKLIFPLVAPDKFRHIVLPVVLRTGRRSHVLQVYCRKQANFRAGQDKHPATHLLGSGYLLPACNRYPIPLYL